jgi:hypothetical protein
VRLNFTTVLLGLDLIQVLLQFLLHILLWLVGVVEAVIMAAAAVQVAILLEHQH